jgi:hypothetical protein
MSGCNYVSRNLNFGMFFDLNVPVPGSGQFYGGSQSKKGKQEQARDPNPISYTPAQISAVENRVDLLVHCQFRLPLMPQQYF